MHCRRAVVTQKLFRKTMSQEAHSNVRLFDRQFQGHGDIRIERYQRRVIQFLGFWVRAIELVSPTADNDDLFEPRLERNDQPAERILDTIHGCFPKGTRATSFQCLCSSRAS